MNGVGLQIAAARASLADAEKVRDFNEWEGQVIEHRTVTIIGDAVGAGA